MNLQSLLASAGDEQSDAALTQLRKHVEVFQGRLIASSKSELLQATLERLQSGEASGFREGEFYTKLMKDVENPRFMVALDFAGIIARQTNDVQPGSSSIRFEHF